MQVKLFLHIKDILSQMGQFVLMILVLLMFGFLIYFKFLFEFLISDFLFLPDIWEFFDILCRLSYFGVFDLLEWLEGYLLIVHLFESY